MTLSLTLRSDGTLPIDVQGLLPERFAGLSHDEVARLPVRIGKRVVDLGEVFGISGDNDGQSVAWEGDLRSVVNLGAGMSHGAMTVDGSVGRDAGRGMTGGRLEISGDAASGAGSGMRGGMLRIRGDVGDRAAAADPGHRHGMSGGCLLVEGSAGIDLARGIRRGLVVVRGSCGAGAMMDATAGTVIVLGECGPHLAAGMRRGTLICLGSPPSTMMPTFVAGRISRPPFLSLLAAELNRWNFDLPPGWACGAFRQYHGDMLTLGLGEVFVPEAVESA